MAAIDKIYGNSEEYLEFYSWAKEHCTWILKSFCDEPYYVSENPIDDGDFPIASLSWLADMYLLGNCPIKWVREYIRHEQYSSRCNVHLAAFSEHAYSEATKEYESTKGSKSNCKYPPVHPEFIAWRNKGYPFLDS